MKIQPILLLLVISMVSCDDERSLLLQFKNSLTFDPDYSTKLKTWNQSIECCDWSGVTCNDEAHVIALDLIEENIQGALDNSSSLFSLQHLQSLNLASNDFNSSIPSKFNKLQTLTYLNLSGAGFVGQVPTEISQLTRLVTLDLSFYGISLDSPLEVQDFGKLVQNLTNIRKLYLDGVSISGEGHEWYNALLLLPSLEELSMSDCGLMGTFPPEIFQITTLSYIDISVNQDLHGSFLDFPLNGSLHTIIVGHTKFSGTLPLSMGNMVNLSILYLYNCHFSGTLPISFSKLTELKEMDLSNNNFVGPISSSALFEGMQSLSSIDLSYNSISGTIPSSLFMIPSLQYVDLSNNQFSKLEEFIDVFTSKLEYLDLSCNNLSGSIPPPIFQLRGLASLNLSNNKLSGPIPPSIIQHSGLNELDLSSNKFSGAMQIDALVQLKNLNDLDLSFNKIDDVNFTDVALSTFPQLRSLNLASCNLKTFPGFLRYQSGLNELDLSYNQIQGTVPNWIWRLDSLGYLDVSHNFLTNFEGPLQNLTQNLDTIFLQFNQLQGPFPGFLHYAAVVDYSSNNFSSVIPVDIGHYMSNTLYLSLANNSFHGSIPHSLCSASKLQVLDLSHNKISGKVPHCLMNLGETLGVLNLGNNELTGHIPDTFPSSCALHTVVLNENRLAGPLPKSLAHCTALEVLDVGRNQIVGAFPCFLSHISKLLVLVLRNNKFHGPMGCPKDNGLWNMIQIVDAAFNNFSGELPVKWFRGWKKMISNDDGANSELSNIQFGRDNSDPIYYQDSVTVISKGQEMELVKILTIFTSIDFSYNQFEGPIPIELMKFKALFLLNLSHNAFSGQIPSSIENLNQLESLDLSMNSLEGEIPTELANLNFLSYLNLSFNHLTGKIPTGTQLQSFEASSFEGNNGLYGPPLTKSPNHGMHALPPPEMPPCGSLACEVHWNLVSAEMGLVFGLGIIFGPLLFWKKWRVHYCQFLDKILCQIFPQLTHNFERRGGQNYKVLVWRRC
ncbi:receptor-like protein 7 isoform X1 [Arachis duranensis]|uniref:Receptor-like protein 7 isoform X1 n=2 Tax=Arachis duranensis TaxID=130453 RepID=A0A6P4CG41_ARADU|nr:receptor-like protein 7 isoform X1 [Arachis duranensis]